jgi:hypothetical protein
MTQDAQHRLPSPTPRRSNYWLLGASLLLHIFVLLLIAGPFKNPPQKIVHKPRAIKATLVYPQFVTPPLPSSKQQPASPAKDSVAPEVVGKSASTVTAQVSSPIPVVKTIPPVKEKIVNSATTKPGVISDNQGPSVKEQVQQQLKGFNQQAIADVAAEEATRYRRQLSSPSLLGKPATSQLSEEEKFSQARQVRANCSNKLNQGVAILSMITGGNVTCSKQPDIDAFIQDRIDKKAHIPAQGHYHKP